MTASRIALEVNIFNLNFAKICALRLKIRKVKVKKFVLGANSIVLGEKTLEPDLTAGHYVQRPKLGLFVEVRLGHNIDLNIS